ncbi:MAG: hypothetical protein KJI71_01670 [Patescibacteria group bacterium]|nr:hypothetical protein [Patescibacteria group bacterium]
MKNRIKRIGLFIGLTLLTGIILSVISARINVAYPQENEFFNYQMFLLTIAGMAIAIIISLLFRKSKRRGKL